MGIDWNRTTMTLAVLIIGSILLLTPVAIAVVGSGGTAIPGNKTSAGGPAGNASRISEKNASISNASQAGKISDKDIGYWPNGPAGSTFARNLKEPHFKGWIGGPLNPWVYRGIRTV